MHFADEFRSLKELLLGTEKLHETRWDLLTWTLGLQTDMRDKLMKVPERYLVVVLALVFLCKVNVAREANSLPVLSIVSLVFRPRKSTHCRRTHCWRPSTR